MSPAYSTAADTAELKSQILRMLGRRRAEKYFYNLKRLLTLKIAKPEFDKLCCATIGRDNVPLHNLFIRSILGNALHPRPRLAPTGHSRNTAKPSTQPLPPPLRRGRSRRRIGDRTSPLGPHGNVGASVAAAAAPAVSTKTCVVQQAGHEVISVDSKVLQEVASVEDGEEVEQARGSPGIQSRSPLTPPLGIPIGIRGLTRSSRGLQLCRSEVPETCQSSSELPDTMSLMKRLEGRLENEGLGLSKDCANLLNSGLDEFMKRLMKPCMELARSRCSNERMTDCTDGELCRVTNAGCNTIGGWRGEHMQRPSQCYSASVRDFQVSMELNPKLLGINWPIQLEKISLCVSEE